MNKKILYKFIRETSLKSDKLKIPHSIYWRGKLKQMFFILGCEKYWRNGRMHKQGCV